MTLYLVNYATVGKFETIQTKVNSDLRKYVDGIFSYNDLWIKERDIYKDNLYIFSQKHGAGNALWKPYIILETLNKINDGDDIIYLDVADYIYNKDFFSFVKNKLTQYEIFLVLNMYKHGEWTKRDCFIEMNCDDNKYWDSRQLEAGTCGFRKTEKNLNLITEWLHWCQFPTIMTDDKSILGDDLDGFKQTRCDQSILTNLMIKYSLPTIDIFEIFKYIKYNEFA
jgi:hypothetical protein